MMTQSRFRRLDQFRENLSSFKKNNLDRFIKGFRESDPTTPYVLVIPKIEGIDLENMRGVSEISALEYCKVTIQFHMSLLYRNLAEKREDRKIFFFGRTAKSRPIPLKKESKGTKYCSAEQEHVFLHSNLEKVCKDCVFLVLECVITIDPQ